MLASESRYQATASEGWENFQNPSIATQTREKWCQKWEHWIREDRIEWIVGLKSSDRYVVILWRRNKWWHAVKMPQQHHEVYLQEHRRYQDTLDQYSFSEIVKRKRQTRPHVREGGPHGEHSNLQTRMNIWSWALDGVRHTDRQLQCEFDSELETCFQNCLEWDFTFSSTNLSQWNLSDRMVVLLVINFRWK
jgi:hypothetical protein